MDVADDLTIVGEECHIVASKDEGPRGDTGLSREQRDAYENLILLCRNHHRLIDDNEDAFTVAALESMKEEHEAWVRESLEGYDQERQRDEELYATYLEEWESRGSVDEWENWTSGLLAHGQPRIAVARLEELGELRRWIFRRVWPGRYPALDAAFENFGRVLEDLIKTMRADGHRVGPAEDQTMQVEKVYQRLDRWDPPAYERLAKRYDFTVDLVEDLVLELTRAGNLICDEVRRSLLPTYRLDQGVLVVTSGPHMDLSWKTYKPQYETGTAPSDAYEGLEDFLTSRENRDQHFGSGKGPE